MAVSRDGDVTGQARGATRLRGDARLTRIRLTTYRGRRMTRRLAAANSGLTRMAPG